MEKRLTEPDAKEPAKTTADPIYIFDDVQKTIRWKGRTDEGE